MTNPAKYEYPITKPFLDQRELDLVQTVLNSGWLVQGRMVQQFETHFAERIHVDHAVASTSCTTALHLAMVALGLRPGDEVIVPAFTWIATPNAVEYQGARPVFCDIDLHTYNLDVNEIESKMTTRTVGILPVHLFGLCADMKPVLDIAERRGLWVVEDAACAFGAFYQDRHAGTFGDIGCFSFHPRKSITTGEGGMLVTGDESIAQKSRMLRDHGAMRGDRARHQSTQGFLLGDFPELGYNYRMTDLQGALGCAQLEKSEWILQKRAEIARAYTERLCDLSWLQTPVCPDGFRHGYQSYVCLFQPQEPNLANMEYLHEQRNTLMMRLQEKGITTRQGTHAPVLTQYYRGKYGLRAEDFPRAVLADRLSLALPLYPQMTPADVDIIHDQLQESFHVS